MAKSKNTDETIEGKLHSIDTIIEQLESGELTLEQSLKLFTDGTQLIHDCRNILDHTTKKIEEVSQSKVAESHSDDFDDDDIPF